MGYVRNCWYVAAFDVDLEDDKPFAVTILDNPLVIWKRPDGTVHVLEDRCVHRLAPLSLGRCEGDNLRCMYHGMLFASDGRAIEIPGQAQIPPQARVRAYPAMVRHSWVWVWMGEPNRADPALIPPAVGYDDPGYILGHGYLDYKAEARLISDNLTDFSHLTFVHAQSFGTGPAFAASQPKVTPLERGVRVERWIEGDHRRGLNLIDDDVDTYSTYDYLLPGVLLMQSASFPAGTAAAVGFGVPDFDRSIAGRNFTSQAVTPMTGKTARYFFNWGPHRSQGDEAMRDAMMKMAGMAFAEDKVMIEGQQAVIDRTDNPVIMPTAHDKGVTLFNRLVDRLCAAEQLTTPEGVAA